MDRVARSHKETVRPDFREAEKPDPSEEETTSSEEKSNSEEETSGDIVGEKASES